MLEGLLGGARALRAVAPADGERMRLGDHALAGDAGGDRRLQHLGELDEGRRVIHAAQAGVDADAHAGGRRAGRAAWRAAASSNGTAADGERAGVEAWPAR